MTVVGALVLGQSLLLWNATGGAMLTRYEATDGARPSAQDASPLDALLAQAGLDAHVGPMPEADAQYRFGLFPSGIDRHAISLLTIGGPALLWVLVGGLGMRPKRRRPNTRGHPVRSATALAQQSVMHDAPSRRWQVTLAAGLASITLCFNPALAADSVAQPAAAAITQARDALRSFVDASPVPGLSVAINMDGRLVWAEGFGYADLELRTPARANTVYRIGSISKPVTAAVASCLAHSGRLDLDASIHELVPEFPKPPNGAITARYLAGHLGGIRHYAGQGEVMSAVHYDTLTDALEIFAHDPLVCVPGAQMSYTTYGYTLLGVVMERAADLSFPELMQQELFGPLGMHSTVVDDPRAIVPNRSKTYTYDLERGITNAPATDHSYKIPGGGFLSSAIDVAAFGAAVAEPRWLDAGTLQLMFTPMRTTDGRELGYSMGWQLRSDAARRRLYGHGGNQPGGRAYLLVYPDANVSIAILANINGAPIGNAEAMMIAEPFVEYAEGVRPEPAAMDPTGTYVLTTHDGDLEQDVTATLEIRERFGKWIGSMSVFVERIEFDSVLVDGRSLRAIGFEGKRLMLIELDVAEDGTVDGQVRHGERTRTFTGQHAVFAGH